MVVEVVEEQPLVLVLKELEEQVVEVMVLVVQVFLQHLE